jgi:hypothetical protein
MIAIEMSDLGNSELLRLISCLKVDDSLSDLQKHSKLDEMDFGDLIKELPIDIVHHFSTDSVHRSIVTCKSFLFVH